MGLLKNILGRKKRKEKTIPEETFIRKVDGELVEEITEEEIKEEERVDNHEEIIEGDKNVSPGLELQKETETIRQEVSEINAEEQPSEEPVEKRIEKKVDEIHQSIKETKDIVSKYEKQLGLVEEPQKTDLTKVRRLSSLKTKELVKIATELGIKDADKLKKSTLIDLIRTRRSSGRKR